MARAQPAVSQKWDEVCDCEGPVRVNLRHSQPCPECLLLGVKRKKSGDERTLAEAPAAHPRRAARRYHPGLAGAGQQWPVSSARAEGRFICGKVKAPGRRRSARLGLYVRRCVRWAGAGVGLTLVLHISGFRPPGISRQPALPIRKPIVPSFRTGVPAYSKHSPCSF